MIEHKLKASGVDDFFIESKREAYSSGMIEYLPYVLPSESPYRTSCPSSFALRAIRDYGLEYNLEIARKAHFSFYPSRLASLFAFGDLRTCEQVAAQYDSWNLDSVRRFSLADMGPFNDLIRITKHNMEIISWLRSFDQVLLPPELKNVLFSAYWEGKDELPLEILHEYGYESPAINVFHEYLICGVLDEVLG